MKYRKPRLPMEAVLPSLQNWLGQELEMRGIDSLIYTRYIISLLQQDSEDLDAVDTEVDMFHKKEIGIKRLKAEKTNKKKPNTTSKEERKKSAAIECLTAVSDEGSGIDKLVEELCCRLNQINITKGPTDTAESSSVPSSVNESSENSGSELEDPAERYYAAFPALSGQESSPQSTPPDSSLSVWNKNPITSLNSDEDADSPNSRECAVYKQKEGSRKEAHGKTTCARGKENRGATRTSKESRYSVKPDGKNSSPYGQKQRHISHHRGKREPGKACRFLSWPPNGRSTHRSYQMFEDKEHESKEMPKRENEELCTMVENLLKEILLPTPVSQQKDWSLQQSPSECIASFGLEEYDRIPELQREGSVSPELQENNLWYTQPIDEILYMEETPGKRLYKRHSYPSFLNYQEEDSGCVMSTFSSPVFTNDVSGDSCFSGEEDMSALDLDSSNLIPAILCQELSVEPDLTNLPEDDNPSSFEKSDEAKMDLERDCSWIESDISEKPLIVCDPTVVTGQDTCQKPTEAERELEWPCSFILLGMPDGSEGEYGATIEADRDLAVSTDSSTSVKTIPSGKDDGTFLMFDFSIQSAEESGNDYLLSPISLLDWDYLSRLIDSDDFQTFPREDIVWSLDIPVFAGLHWGIETPCWQSKVLFNDSLSLHWDFASLLETESWITVRKHGELSQLWDVNSHKKQKNACSAPWNAEGFAEFLTPAYMWSTAIPSNDADGEHDESNQESRYSCRVDQLLDSWADGNFNTLIPQITFETTSAEDAEDNVFMDNNDYYVGSLQCQNNIWTDNTDERIVSPGDFRTLWAEDPSAQLSQSFELVPSEHSAFEEMFSRKVHHVHSEPDLKHCTETHEKNRRKSEGTEPVDEDKTDSSANEHLYFSPKTHFRPIQTPPNTPEPEVEQEFQPQDLFGGVDPTSKTPYQVYTSGVESHMEVAFVPKFKIQKDLNKYIQTGDSFEEDDLPNPEHISDQVSEYKIDSSAKEATSTVTYDALNDAEVKSIATEEYAQLEDLVEEFEESDVHSPVCESELNMVEHEIALPDYLEENLKRINAEEDLLNLCTEHKDLLEDLSNTQDEVVHANDQIQALQDEDPRDHVAFTLIDTESWDVPSLWFSNTGEFFDETADPLLSKNIWSTELGTELPDIPDLENYMLHVTGEQEVSPQPSCRMETPARGSEVCNCPWPDQEEGTDYVRIKLVYKNSKTSGNCDKNIQQDMLLETYTGGQLMPMPNDAVYSCDLERQWFSSESLDPVQFSNLRRSRFQRKPCSFFLEGNCRRTDCKFSHDISNITCRFWEEEDCFKGDMCPFLHGYPSDSDSGALDENQELTFEYNNEEFPELLCGQKPDATGKLKKNRNIEVATQLTKTPNKRLVSRKRCRPDAARKGEKQGLT